jgi:hypothetical protein
LFLGNDFLEIYFNVAKNKNISNNATKLHFRAGQG